ncbi:hypothetical protein CBS101457_005391 [Exobasidium rhododendri]|nr:hypothetical protein CBS101457_005391 [Exobasidium rhododendri]
MVTPNDTTGTRGHLTPTQTRILYKLWQRFFRLCESPMGYASGTSQTSASTSAQSSDAYLGGGDRQIGPSPCSSCGEKQAGPSSSSPLSAARASEDQTKPNVARTLNSPSQSYGRKPLQRHPSRGRQIDDRSGNIPKDDKVKDELKTMEEAKEMREFLEKYGGERLREVFWDIVKGEHPDAIMLRFLRARKWDIDRAIAVIGSTAAFRVENDVKGIVKGGELELSKTRGGKKIFTNGISYVYGASSIGEPVYFIEVGKHFSHNQTQEELKKGVILLQEWLQMLMPPPIEKKVVIFNLNDFGIRNMDWWCVFFMVKTMESYYVETLARVYVHGAPWIFRPIWAVLKPLLDPVVRDKIRLTSSPEELSDFIPFDHLPKLSMRGGMDWEFDYPSPEEDENSIQLNTEDHNRFAKKHDRLMYDFEKATKEICQLYSRSSIIQRARDGAHQDLNFDDSDGDDAGPDSAERVETDYTTDETDEGPVGNSELIGEDLKAKRDLIATRLRVAFLQLKPYVVGKSQYTRWNVARADGSIHWKYTSVDGVKEEQILGQGTTLPDLQGNLDLIDSASASQEISALSQSLSLQSLEKETLRRKEAAAAIQESNRQKRLRNRTKSIETQSKLDEPLPTTLNDSQSNANSSSTITPGKGVESLTSPGDLKTTKSTFKGDNGDEDDDEDDAKASKPVPIHPLREHPSGAVL